MKNARLGFMVILLSLSVLALGCSQQAIPRQPGETIAAAEVALDAIQKSILAASKADVMSDEIFLDCFRKIMKANFHLDAANRAHSNGDSVGAWAWLDQVLAQISAIRKEVPDGY